VEWVDIVGVRNGSKATIAPRSIAATSHLLAYWVKEQPLGACLGSIIDQGEILSPLFWHPLRVPVVHSPEAVSSLAANLQMALESLDTLAKAVYVVDSEIASIVRVLHEAMKESHAIVSVLEPPADKERAQRVACPFDEPENLPTPWGNLEKTLGRFLNPDHLM
jgi:hypothetical protein